MNRFIKSAAAVAVAVLCVGNAQAVVSLNTGAGAVTYASELLAAGTTLNNAGNEFDATVKLGFGVSNAQTRYIRLDVSNATMGTIGNPIGNADVVVTEAGKAATGPAGVTVAQTGTNFIIFQITAQDLYTQAADVAITMPGLTATSSSSAVLTYSLYEDAPSAANGGTSGRVSTASAPVYNSNTGLVFDAVPGSVTAEVSNLYKTFIGGLATGEVGRLTYGVTPATLVPATGVQVSLADLVSPASAVSVVGNFTAAAGVGSVFLGAPNCGGVGLAGAVAVNELSASLPVGTVEYNNVALCYTTDGTTPIVKQTIAGGNPITAALDLTAAVGSSASDKAAENAGEIAHDGTTLRFPSIRGVNGVTTRIQLANQSVNPTSYSATCYGISSTTANLVSWAGVGGTIGANNHVDPLTAAVCPANAGTSAASAVITVASPVGTVFGTLRRINTTTGVVTDVPAQ